MGGAEKVEAGFEFAGAVASGKVTTHGAARKAMTAYGKRVG